jgi:hypothetical protein
MRKTASRSLLAIASFGILFSYSAARAELNSVSAGFTVPTPLGDYYQRIKRSVGFEAQATYHLGFFGDHTDVLITGLYQPFSVIGVEANLNFLGLFGGLRTRGGPAALGLIPFASASIGTVYDWLSFKGVDSLPNSAVTFGVQFDTGVELPIGSLPLSVVVDFPFTAAFFKAHTFTMWSANFSVKWRP